jgi:hypothetical protein
VAAVRSPAAVVRQQDNRQSSAAPKPDFVESDSTVAPQPTDKPAEPANPLPPKIAASAPENLPAYQSAVSTPASPDEVLALREQLAEVSDALKSTLADNEMMGRVFDADDRLKAAMDEAKRQKAIAENAERTLASKSGEFIERARAVTHWQNRALKAEKALAKLEAIK